VDKKSEVRKVSWKQLQTSGSGEWGGCRGIACHMSHAPASEIIATYWTRGPIIKSER